MKIYAHQGHNRFVLCLGYKGEMIKQYFMSYEMLESNITVSLGRPTGIEYHSRHQEDGWKISLVDTGLDSNTGARLKRIEGFINADTFMLTYGDGVSNVDINRLLDFHREHGRCATVTAVHPPARFGELTLDGPRVAAFEEKPQVRSGRINGGFFVFTRKLFDYLTDDDACSLEKHALPRLSADGELMAYEHDGFWQCMDTVRELNILSSHWESGTAPWKRW